MAFDARRRRVLLFGGVNTDTKPPTVYGDTWVWDGASWHCNANSGPVPRFAQAMAYDGSRGRIVLFGGRAADLRPLNDTWEWDGRAWRQLRTAHTPSPRLLHALAYDEPGQRLIVLGGWAATEGGARYLPDTWQFKNNDWTRIEAPGPPPMRAHFMVGDRHRREIVLFGGYDDNQVYGDTWVWNGSVWRQQPSMSRP